MDGSSRLARSGTRRPSACSSLTLSMWSNRGWQVSPRIGLYLSSEFTEPRLIPAELLFQTIQAAAVDTRAELYKHIVLSGGSSMYPGFPSRLEKEMKQLYMSRVLGGDGSRLKVSAMKRRPVPYGPPRSQSGSFPLCSYI